MRDSFTTTRIYPTAERVAAIYAAWVQLHENRRISKEKAVNELVVKAGADVLPAEIVPEAMGQTPTMPGMRG